MMIEIDCAAKIRVKRETWKINGSCMLTPQLGQRHMTFLFIFSILEAYILVCICFMLAKICFVSLKSTLKMSGIFSPKCQDNVRNIRNLGP